MRILVTGGAGAIGSHLVALLLERGHDVVVLDDLSSGRRELLPAGAELIVGSVAESDDLAAALDTAPQRIAHLAALFANQNSVDHPELDLAVNGLGTLKVLDGARERGIAKVLVCSSSCVYAEGGVLEEDQMGRSQATPYAITKGLAEDYGRFYAAHHGLDVVVVRPFNSYGPHEHPGPYRNVIPNFLAAAIAGRPLRITGTGQETRDFTFVGDIANGMALALLGETAPGSVFNLASGIATRITDLAAHVNRITGNEAGVELVPRRAWDRTVERRASIARSRAVLGYEPATRLEDGLVLTYDWLRQVHA